MGKRKSRTKSYKPPPPKVETMFDCPFCSNSHCVEIKM
jgi:transcription elongation factor Elf1